MIISLSNKSGKYEIYVGKALQYPNGFPEVEWTRASECPDDERIEAENWVRQLKKQMKQ